MRMNFGSRLMQRYVKFYCFNFFIHTKKKAVYALLFKNLFIYFFGFPAATILSLHSISVFTLSDATFFVYFWPLYITKIHLYIYASLSLSGPIFLNQCCLVRFCKRLGIAPEGKTK